MKELRLVSGYDILYGKVKEFIQDCLFVRPIELDNLNRFGTCQRSMLPEHIEHSRKRSTR